MARDTETINYLKLRKDLIFSRQQMAGETIVVVKDRVKGAYFRLREAEWFITEQFDGETSLETVQKRAEEKFGATLPQETLRVFVLNLSKKGFFETGKREGRSSPSRGKQRIRGSLLYLRFHAFDPDRLFTRLAQKVWFFNTPHFVIFSAALILMAMGITFTHWSAISQDVDRLYQVSAIPLILLTMFVVTTAHEFAHGLTCKQFGGEVHEVGFMLIYFQPAFYCDVSDAWLFPEKSRRLWVGFAGPFFELFLWAIATFLWLITEADTLINFISLIVMASSGIKTLLNFNPLIKLDGYYLLSDYLEMPNLRRKAFRYIGNGIKRLSGLVVEETESPTARERRIYLIYGLIATVVSFSLLALVFVQAGKALIENNKPILLALLVGLIGLRLRMRLQRLFGRSTDPDDEDGPASPDPKASHAISDVASEENKITEKRYPVEQAENKTLEKRSPDELAEKTALEKRPPDELVEQNEKLVRRSSRGPDRHGKRRRRSWKRPIRLVVVIGAISAILYFGKMEHRIAGQFHVLPVRSADVRVEIEGIIEMIAVKEGDQVREGDLIARLSDRDLRPEVAKTEARIQQTQAKLKMLEAGPTAMEIEVAKSSVARAEESLKYARKHASRNQQLFNEQIISRKDFETTQELAALAENQLVEANNKLNVVLQGARPEEIAATKSEIEGLVTQRRHLEDQLRRLNLYSTTTGIIATPARQLKELRRQLVKKGDLISKIYDPRAMTAEIIISEKEITDVKVGQKVSLKALTYPDLTFEGTVTAISVAAQGGGQSSTSSASAGAASLARTGSTSKTILVTTQLDNSLLLLKPEMTGHAKIYCGQRSLIDLLRWRLARVIKVEFWSWW
jgi:putative peptide zinc metalloprotease protein